MDILLRENKIKQIIGDVTYLLLTKGKREFNIEKVEWSKEKMTLSFCIWYSYPNIKRLNHSLVIDDEYIMIYKFADILYGELKKQLI